MVCRYTLEEQKRKETPICKSPAMVGAQGCVISEISSTFNLDSRSFLKNRLLLACMLRNVTDIGEVIFDKYAYTGGVDSVCLKKKKPTVSTRAGGDSTGQSSSDGLIPGLYDDMAMDILTWASRSDYPNLACVSKKLHELITSGDLYKLRRQMGVIEQWVYLACSNMPWEAFDPARHRWMRLPRMPCDDCFTYADKESLAVGTELLVFGRELSGFAIWMYSLLNHQWSRCPLMSLPRCLFGSSSSAEIAIVAGGSDKNGCILKSAELYNSELRAWESLPDMNLPRKLCSGFFMDGKFYVIGGISSQSGRLTCGEEYNIETRTWRRINDMIPGWGGPMQSPPLVAVVNNQLYGADLTTNEVKKYDKTNNTWNVVKRLPVRADSNNGWGLAFKACGDKLLVVGGRRRIDGEVIVLHSWRPEDGNREGLEWDVLSIRERAGGFVYNCAVMGC
ncbi:F-box/kelch-repeat protein At5g60570-like isoform X1 [Macadamia integrifolia]|uniref:F-box/kelch-repeat protein At5g60570-like isoform X1 n=2 Tax=Macadamia integrifolia TaxID=60698 RepID=UPI001C4FA3A5|nr:F-box/kelch-repeat protein At5g60570-like isoform X1 [Macadamia integrifolia]XP_042492586.1 F-box/kelch-repeat protein At5g60570-like isoform X1 [Macadamia integrifolia]XP_042492587.1 F-box/kelch-repeat protein At5g60570-like isoform X1 [Macadamia integrifolia]